MSSPDQALKGNTREQGRAGDPLLMKDAVFI